MVPKQVFEGHLNCLMDSTNHYNTSCRKDVEKGKQQVLMKNGNDMSI